MLACRWEALAELERLRREMPHLQLRSLLAMFTDSSRTLLRVRLGPPDDFYVMSGWRDLLFHARNTASRRIRSKSALPSLNSTS